VELVVTNDPLYDAQDNPTTVRGKGVFRREVKVQQGGRTAGVRSLIDSSNVTIVDIHQVFKARFNPDWTDPKGREGEGLFRRVSRKSARHAGRVQIYTEAQVNPSAGPIWSGRGEDTDEWRE
jgi:hypothetical protein